MINFKKFLVEQEEEQQGQKLKHLEHINRLPLTGGNEGVSRQVLRRQQVGVQ